MIIQLIIDAILLQPIAQDHELPELHPPDRRIMFEKTIPVLEQCFPLDEITLRQDFDLRCTE